VLSNDKLSESLVADTQVILKLGGHFGHEREELEGFEIVHLESNVACEPDARSRLFALLNPEILPRSRRRDGFALVVLLSSPILITYLYLFSIQGGFCIFPHRQTFDVF